MTPRTGRRECYYLAPFDTAGGVPIVACGDAGFGFGSGTVSRLGGIDCALTRARGVAVAVMKATVTLTATMPMTMNRNDGGGLDDVNVCRALLSMPCYCWGQRLRMGKKSVVV